MRAKPTVAFATRVDPATDERRRRLQELTGRTTPELINDALKLLEIQLKAERSVSGSAA